MAALNQSRGRIILSARTGRPAIALIRLRVGEKARITLLTEVSGQAISSGLRRGTAEKTVRGSKTQMREV